MSHDNTIEQIQHLANVNKDAGAALRHAADGVKNSELETLFRGYAQQHEKFAAELGAEIERLGGSSSATGTAGGGALHRGWMDVKALLSGHSATAFLKSCVSGEESAEVAYLDAAEGNPSGRTHTLLDKQHQQITGFRTHLARLVAEGKHGVEFQKNE